MKSLYITPPDKWAQFSDEELQSIFARCEGISIESARTFTRDSIVGMMSVRRAKKVRS